MKINVLTLSWNGLDKLIRLKKGLHKNLLHTGCTSTWYIRDNGSKDGTVDEISAWNVKNNYPIETKVYDIGHNLDNFAQGMNFLFDKANPADDDVILLLNNDIVFNDINSLANMLSLMNKTGAAIVGSRLLYYDKPDLLCHSGVIFSKRYNFLPFHYRHKEKTDINAEKNRWFQAVTAACCLVRTSSWKYVGGLCEKYRWAFDDIDFNLKIGQKEKIAYCGQTNILHEESSSLRKNPVNKLFLNQNVQLFKQNWWGKYEIDHEKYLNDPDYNVIA